MKTLVNLLFFVAGVCLISMTHVLAVEKQIYETNGVTSFYGEYEVNEEEKEAQEVLLEQEKQKLEVPMYQNNQKIIPITGDNPMKSVQLLGVLLIIIIISWIIKEKKMQKHKLKFSMLLLVGSYVLGGNISQAAEYDSNMVVSFEPDVEITKPISPTEPNPEQPIVPLDPTNPTGPVPGTGGPLSIDFASGLQFGKQKITTVDKTYFAQIQEYTDHEGVKSFGPNFVQVTDKRGTQGGWELSVKENHQFQTNESEELVGAQVSLLNGGMNSNMSETFAPQGTEVVNLIPDTEQTVVVAAEKKGMGTWIYHFGSDAEQGKTSIKLEVPGESVKLAKEYTTKLTWSLKEVPQN